MREFHFTEAEERDLRVLLKDPQDEFCAGTVKAADRVRDTNFLRLQVDFGGNGRQIVSSIGEVYAPESLIGDQLLFVLEPSPLVIEGFESYGSVVVSIGEKGFAACSLAFRVPDGTILK